MVASFKQGTYECDGCGMSVPLDAECPNCVSSRDEDTRESLQGEATNCEGDNEDSA